jgi:hypothetical protein
MSTFHFPALTLHVAVIVGLWNCSVGYVLFVSVREIHVAEHEITVARV